MTHTLVLMLLSKIVQKSMKCVVEELYNLNKFPQLIFRLKNALDYGFSKMETDVSYSSHIFL